MNSTTVNLSKTTIAEQVMKVFKATLNKMTDALLLPIIGITIFLFLWSIAASSIQTSLGEFPGPNSVVKQFSSLYEEHVNLILDTF